MSLHPDALTLSIALSDNLRRNLRKYEQAVNIAKPEPTN